MNNIILKTDSYKPTQYVQYPPKTTKVFSYLESRGGVFKETVFAGLQALIIKNLVGQVVTKEKIDEAEEVFAAHFNNSRIFNRSGWEHILNKHGGRLPIIIKAIPEGTVVPTSNVLMTVENTDPEAYWLTSYLETLLLHVWYPTTVATLSRECKKLILSYLEATGTPESIDFKLHDFGFRGVSSDASAGMGGLGHLVNFKGTDTLEAIMYARKYYGCAMAGFSIPAMEHSTVTSWTRENEVHAYQNMMEKYPEGIVAIVSDSYDVYNAVDQLFGNVLRSKIVQRPGCIVVRPDSGDPVEVNLRILELLENRFASGMSYNSKGYKVLPPYIRIIQGDGVDLESMGKILQALRLRRWSADNIAFGMGGALLQKMDRDTQKFAFKCSYSENIFGKVDVFKDPITSTSKRSKAGRLSLVDINGKLTTVPEVSAGEDLLQTVFHKGELLNSTTLGKMRERAKL